MIESDLVEIAVEAPLPKLLTYRLPSALLNKAQWGSRVAVPLGRRRSRGVLVAPASESNAPSGLKDVEEIFDEPALGEKTRQWLKWLAQYYLHPPGQVYSMAFAPGEEKRKRKTRKKSPLALADDAVEKRPPPVPNPGQKSAIDAIRLSMQENHFETFLLYGVTGSGKTEVYLQSIDSVIKSGKQALVLVPEISLTPQLIKRFVGRFGENVAVIHSHLTERERADQWWSAVKGEKKILVGARSALFCPLENLGLIVVDEEHESSFKQEEQLKYNARDAAIMRARICQCPVVLGSATPSLESWQNVQSGKFKILELSQRVENRPLPQVDVVDMRQYKGDRDFNIPSWMSPLLHKELKKTLENKEQAALFLNRRGYAQFLLCSGCGYTEQCPHCSVTLTVHKKNTELLCHYCGFTKNIAWKCPSCRQNDLRSVGLGTEKVTEELQALFPEARVVCADRDQITNREDLETLLDKINGHEVDFIVGTQMIAKGHDFPNLTLVGTILADVGLHFPDFRSSERTFQLLTQVAGRAGRHQKAGKVIIQTYMPDHPAIQCSTNHDFAKFAQDELAGRQELGFPPFGKLAIVRIQGSPLDKVESAALKARTVADSLRDISASFKDIEIMGPTEAVLAKLRNKFRFQVLLKSKSANALNIFLQHFTQKSEWVPPGIKISVDVDPLHLL